MSEERADFNPAARMMNLKGKEYLPVAERIVWFRNDYPEGTIETAIHEIDREKGFAMFTAEVCTGQGGRATATGTETAKDFGDFIEKAETKAVGRALGYLGYGTASAGFEEGHRIVDTPIPPRASARRSDPPAPAPSRPAVALTAAGQPQPEPPRGDEQGDQRATERQVKFIYAIAREAGLDEQELAAWSQELYAAEVDRLNRRDASTLIEALQRRRNEVA